MINTTIVTTTLVILLTIITTITVLLTLIIILLIYFPNTTVSILLNIVNFKNKIINYFKINIMKKVYIRMPDNPFKGIKKPDRLTITYKPRTVIDDKINKIIIVLNALPDISASKKTISNLITNEKPKILIIIKLNLNTTHEEILELATLIGELDNNN